MRTLLWMRVFGQMIKAVAGNTAVIIAIFLALSAVAHPDNRTDMLVLTGASLVWGALSLLERALATRNNRSRQPVA